MFLPSARERKQAGREQAIRDQAVREQAAREQAAREQAAREQVLRDRLRARQQEARDQAIQAIRDQAARDQAAREQAVREQAAREQAARDQAVREQAVREQAVREQAAREQAARDQAARDQAAREQAAREQAAREQAAREQAAREQAAREQAAREQAVREQAARDEAAREQAAREQAENEQRRKAEEAELQVLQYATTLSCIDHSFSSGRPAEIPYEMVKDWTNGFEKSKIIGSGGFGVVYEGTVVIRRNSSGDKHRTYRWEGTKVAIKTVNPSLLERVSTMPMSTGDGLERDIHCMIRREINVLSSFHDNPNLIRLIGFCLSKQLDELCLVYEHGTRGDLMKMLTNDSSILPWNYRLRIALGIAKGLNFMHKKKSYHRDVKSSNVVITHDFMAKMIDCGLSKGVVENNSNAVVTVFSTTLGTKFGTPEYMCYEYQRSSQMTFDSKCEIYCFGILLLELLTGCRQGEKDTEGEQFFLQDNISDLEADVKGGVWPDVVVRELKQLGEECTKKRSKRIQSMDTVLRRLLLLYNKYFRVTQMENELLEENQAMLEELKELRLKAEVEARENSEQRNCCICGLDCPISQGVVCSGDDQHFICLDDFNGMVESQCQHVQDFINNGNAVVCGLCLAKAERDLSPYADPLVCRVSNDAAACRFVKVQREAEKKLQESIAEGRLQRQKEIMDQRLLEEQAKLLKDEEEKAKKKVEMHVKKIQDDILNTRCPHCDVVFQEWDACFAVQHSAEDHTGRSHGCMKWFCGWCLEKCDNSRTCHEHVKHCRLSKHPGSYYGSMKEFQNVQAAVRRQKINDYLNNVDREIRKKTVDTMRSLPVLFDFYTQSV
jgi:serine/threonine protein kinase